MYVAILLIYFAFYDIISAPMDLLKDNVTKLYFKFLTPAMGSAVVMSIYNFIDTIAVGRSESAAGSAAMAVIVPYIAIMSFLAVFAGMGGAVLMSQAFGEGDDKKGKRFFTVSCILAVAMTAIFWVVCVIFKRQIFSFFGASEELMPKVLEYGDLVVYATPLFIVPNFLGCFVRNDKAPAHVMISVTTGAIVNIIGDLVFVFKLNMGMRGAALATVLGVTVQTLIMLTHLLKRKKCNLRFVVPTDFAQTACAVLLAGFSAGVLELGTVAISTMMNNQIVAYGVEANLSVFGVLSTISTRFQAVFAAVGYAVQPISSSNFGARKPDRIRKALFLGVICTLVLGAIFTIIVEAAPTQIVKLFMDVTSDVVAVTPRMTRIFAIWFVFLGLNVVGVYYLQSISRERMAMFLAILRSFVFSALFLYTLPLSMGFDGVMFALPIAEAIVTVLTIAYTVYIHKKLFKPEHIANLVYSEEYTKQPKEL